jgi:hypothetical protein
MKKSQIIDGVTITFHDNKLNFNIPSSWDGIDYSSWKSRNLNDINILHKEMKELRRSEDV